MAKKKETITPEEKLAQALVPKDQQPYELPKGWVWTRAKGIANVIMGQSPKGTETTDDSSQTPLIGGAADLDNLFPRPQKYTRQITKLSQPGDIIVCIRATLGKPVFSDKIYCLGRGVAAFRPLNIDKQYLRYYIINFEKYLYENATGSTFLSISSAQLANMPIPLPSLPEQQRIVARIESLFAKLDAAREKLQQVLDTQEARRAAILHEAFTGRLTGKGSEERRGKREENGSQNSENSEFLPDGWSKAKIKDICSRLSYGTSKKSEKTGKYIVIRMGNLQDGEIDWSNLAYTNDEQEYDKYKLSPGDVLFNRTNSSELVGKTSIYRGNYPAIYAGYLIKLEYDRSVINGEYLNYYLNSPRAKEYYNEVKTDGVNQSNINSKKIGNFDIAFPSIQEQAIIVEKLNSLFKNEKAASTLARQALNQIDLLKKSILARAFRGELGTQDPSDPDARELLLEQ